MHALVVKPHTLSSPGTIGEYAERLGVELVQHVASLDGPLPPLDGFDFVIAMGAPWSVYGEEVKPWIESELELFREAVRRVIPVLGICFGAQAFAQALGGEVHKAEAEVGWKAVHTNDPGLIPEGPWFMWHSDSFSLPAGARLVSWTESGGPQAYTMGPHILVQFHPEVRPDVLEGWNRAEDSDVFERLGIDRAEIEAETERRQEEARERARRLFDRFLVGVSS